MHLNRGASGIGRRMTEVGNGINARCYRRRRESCDYDIPIKEWVKSDGITELRMKYISSTRLTGVLGRASRSLS